MVSSSNHERSAVLVFLIYAALTVVMTWPLASGLTHDIPGDFGDPLFTSWALSWGATHLGRGWWNANIFAPHPLSLAYSEHFLPQALQALPIYALTKNPILCYNLLFLSTFALSAFGMFLLGRELTGSAVAGFVAGLAFGFTPSRIANIPHLQVLSTAWMPFVLYGLHRHFATGRVRPLAGAAAAWLVENLSSGYYLLFFSPIVILYIGWELTRRDRWRDARTLMRVGCAIAIVLAATAPFLLPYLELRRLGFSPRSVAETQRFSADVYAYFTADPNLWLWGPIAQAWPKSEGLLFPGLTIAILAAIGAISATGAIDATGVGTECPVAWRAVAWPRRSSQGRPRSASTSLVEARAVRDPRNRRHALARFFDPAPRHQDHQPAARPPRFHADGRDPRQRLARMSRARLAVGAVGGRHLFHDRRVCGRDVVRSGYQSEGEAGRTNQHLRAVHGSGTWFRWRSRSRPLRDDRDARVGGSGRARHCDDR
jgi:hypothetical protein